MTTTETTAPIAGQPFRRVATVGFTDHDAGRALVDRLVAAGHTTVTIPFIYNHGGELYLPESTPEGDAAGLANILDWAIGVSRRVAFRRDARIEGVVTVPLTIDDGDAAARATGYEITSVRAVG